MVPLALQVLQVPLAQSVPRAQQGLQALMVPLAQSVQQVQLDLLVQLAHKEFKESRVMWVLLAQSVLLDQSELLDRKE